MQAHPTIFWPVWAVLTGLARSVMDIFLHLGAHRTGTESFHDYLHRHESELAAQGVGFWVGARVSGDGAETRFDVSLNKRLAAAEQAGATRFVVSDADILGSLDDNVASAQLYPEARHRLRTMLDAADLRVRRIILSVRSLETYWCSALACSVAGGAVVPARAQLAQLAASTRGWGDVVRDVGAAAPTSELRVLPYETYRGRADSYLSDALDFTAPFDTARKQVNQTPTLPELRRAMCEHGTQNGSLPFGMGRWNPFTNSEHAALRETHADDMMWLTAGADGLATLTEDRFHERAGPTLPHGAQCKGQFDELEERQVARPG